MDLRRILSVMLSWIVALLGSHWLWRHLYACCTSQITLNASSCSQICAERIRRGQQLWKEKRCNTKQPSGYQQVVEIVDSKFANNMHFSDIHNSSWAWGNWDSTYLGRMLEVWHQMYRTTRSRTAASTRNEKQRISMGSHVDYLQCKHPRKRSFNSIAIELTADKSFDSSHNEFEIGQE